MKINRFIRISIFILILIAPNVSNNVNAQSANLRLVSYNLNFLDPDNNLKSTRVARFQTIVDYLIAINPDIIAFQEIYKKKDNGKTTRDDVSELKKIFLDKGVSYNVVFDYFNGISSNGSSVGMAIFSKSPMTNLSSQTHGYSSAGFHRIILGVITDGLFVFNHHPDPAAGCQGAIELRNYRSGFFVQGPGAGAEGNGIAIALGDFNLDPRNPCWATEVTPYFTSLCNTLGTSDASCINSINYYSHPEIPSALIDHIVIDKGDLGNNCNQYALVSRSIDQTFRKSDHLPVLVELRKPTCPLQYP